MMRSTDVMVGNSSSGIIEAPSFGIPVVNIGTRQIGRQRVQNVIDVDYDKDAIIKAINIGLYDKDFKYKANKCVSPYGNGHAGTKVARILESIEITPELMQKKIDY